MSCCNNTIMACLPDKGSPDETLQWSYDTTQPLDETWATEHHWVLYNITETLLHLDRHITIDKVIKLLDIHDINAVFIICSANYQSIFGISKDDNRYDDIIKIAVDAVLAIDIRILKLLLQKYGNLNINSLHALICKDYLK